jgi:catechol 2,3-dioxygenase-like lactoylglutathione lyase family enzyme
MTELPLCQIAISVSDVQRSQRWYRDVFGYQESGGTYMFIPLLGSVDVLGVPDATSVCWWLMDRQDFFQLELFEFSKPIPEPLPADWRPCDIGYTTIGIHVANLDGALERLARRRVPLLSDPIGEPGARRVCVRDPDGVLLEIMEDDPRTSDQRSRPYDVPVATRFVTLEPTPAGKTKITWEAQFRSPLPGVGMISSATLRSLVKGLTTASEQNRGGLRNS